ncbi:MAG TPA: Na+-transporting oxaloacetate decarboxylase subunit gamma [Sulfurovum sp.]|nr:Na+-transporting oxaloacetate decarboxylase subunit gamma [Sulfurovum sp.]
MADVNLILESVKFMVLGMGIVFLFLTIMVIVVNIQAKLIAKFFPEEVPVTPTTSESNNESEHVAAIIAAVTEFRKNK